MRVSSISAARPQQVVFNGSFSKPVKALLDSQTPKLLEAKRLGDISKSDLDKSFEIFSHDYDVMRAKMGEFSYSTILSMKRMKDGSTLFYLENPRSDYKYLMDGIFLRNDPVVDVNIFSTLAERLKKLNPFEIENKFCIQRHSGVQREIFRPEIEL